jgi:hypothetical protein
MIEMFAERYDGFVARCDIASREYAILKDGVIIRDHTSDEQRVIGILCDEADAARLRLVASLVYPEAVLAITTAIDRARE